ncbi:MAG: ABC transporter ATP-binding protein [Candidatus Eremiobacteraeota bacterium]|nr:ABC transporter ATP-binding protein [Candidatus Eremiobacteraeota bacterium]
MFELVILSFENVGKSYGAIRALESFSFEVGRDEIVAVLGPNGAGKTTALDIGVGLRRPDSGSVRLFGLSPRAIAARRRLGVTPQESGFPDSLRAGEIVEFAAAHFRCRPTRAREVLSDFGLDDLVKRPAGSLSGGQARRLALALAFVGEPEIAVLDEPTTGLDIEARRRAWHVIRAAGAGRAILFSTHHLEEAEALASRIVVIDRGRKIFDGAAADLRERFGTRRLSYVGKPLERHTLGFVANITTDRRTTTVATNDTDAYVRALVVTGTPFSELEISPASLEEAFLSMTRR